MLGTRFQVRHFQVLTARLAAGQSQTPAKGTGPAKPTPPAVSDTPVGPGASKAGDYKNPEYYKYNPMSYFDMEVDMAKDRLPQPSSKQASK
ncbi:NADH dehydrogenase [ubiquinone] flavoprotein 3, mitochondrial-like [Pollicipes pollicipes]|uniref:NADH dehydrogenase [ubiquinone] flavoprotein 3, mitochondrial-like n=1 Tax=Pollicipes pollicipes TaxID=41117 RepID=UPI0018857246|nr:NADH dehydrogenase [ubiquinone] flavoprotein 3, mitochondrial-like [Pollicipes pollicipes]